MSMKFVKVSRETSSFFTVQNIHEKLEFDLSIVQKFPNYLTQIKIIYYPLVNIFEIF